MTQGPLAYNLLQKKCNFGKLKFLLEKSVLAYALNPIESAYSRVILGETLSQILTIRDLKKENKKTKQ